MEPKLYWRIKKEGKWTWERAVTAIMSMEDVRGSVRNESPNTIGYGFLKSFKYVPRGEEE